MKKFIIFVSSVIAICSCAKVAEQENISDEAAFEEWNIIGQIETPESKTSYTDMGTYYKFAWVKSDVVGFQLYKKDDAAHVDQIKYVADSDGATTSFTQQAKFNLSNDSRTYDLGDYAFYPKDKNCDLTYSYNASKETSSGYIELKESIQYNSEPTSVIPLLGKRDRTQEETTLGDGATAGKAVTYKFKTITGALKIAIKDLPPKATSIRITGGVGDMLSGNFYLSEDLYNDGAYKTMDGDAVKNSYNTKTITFSGLSGDVDFYFPLPAGNISALTIEVLNGETVLLSKSMKAGKTLDITKGVITELPALTVPPYFEIGVRGTSTAPEGSFYKYNCITRFTVTNSSDTVDKSGYEESNKFSANGTNNWTLANHFSGVLTSSGTYYLHYMVCKNVTDKNLLSTMTDAELIAQGSVPFYFLSPSDITAFMGYYFMTSSSGDISLSLDSSDDSTKGNVILTDFNGTNGKLYGVYDSSKDSSNLVFADSYDNEFTANTYIYSYDKDLNMHLGFDGTSNANYDNRKWDLICWNASLTYEVDGGSTNKYNYVRGNRYSKIGFTSSDLSTNSVHEGDGTGLAGLCDNNTASGYHYHSNWGGNQHYDSTYGIWIDIDLGDSNANTDYKLRYCTRSNSNNHAKHVVIYASDDKETWGSALADVTNALDGINANAGSWTKFISFSTSPAKRYIRVAVLENSNGANLTVSSDWGSDQHYVHIAELELYGK